MLAGAKSGDPLFVLLLSSVEPPEQIDSQREGLGQGWGRGFSSTANSDWPAGLTARAPGSPCTPTQSTSVGQPEMLRGSMAGTGLRDEWPDGKRAEDVPPLHDELK